VVQQSFDFLSDDEMRAQLERGEPFLLKGSKWQEIERQIERLGFEDRCFVTQVTARRGKLTKVTPALKPPTPVVRRAA
jgi:hypothetical protein